MKVFDIITGTKKEAIISLVDNKDFPIIKKSKQFIFNWDKLQGKTIYKIVQKGNADILGLMCTTDHGVGWDAIEIELLEVGKSNVGKGKKTDNIAGCLIAFACRESIKAGHQGWVFLTPKTDLIKHYHSKYGFVDTGLTMASDDINSRKLINKYL